VNESRKFSDETLNAFLDGELDSTTEKEILAAALKDSSLRAHVHELRRVRALVRQALTVTPAQESFSQYPTPRRRVYFSALAACLLVAFGTFVGWSLQTSGTPGKFQGLITPERIRTTPQLISDRQNREVKAILHISTGEARAMRSALDEAEYLLQTYRKAGRPFRLEILVNAEGLDHFRLGKTAFERRLVSMRREYKNLELLACNKTIERLKREKHVNPALVPGVEIVPSALDRILYRLSNGWSYIKA
jgi:intracellular sulfur oxidation DsrE/DsrF family protein